jgi:1-acyl-sn-glycerol-3-phosphate acyltransferase
MAATTQTRPPPRKEAAPRQSAARDDSAPPGGLRGLIARRTSAGSVCVDPPGRMFMDTQLPVWAFLNDHYFRLETEGWHRLPDPPCLLVGIHSGGPLTMDAWTLVAEWYRRFGKRRVLHATAHDVLMALPGLGDYFRSAGVIPASRRGVTAALEAGHDVIVWPGGEVDAMRSWRKRDHVVLAGRKGFVRQAIRSGVPIVPVATIGGHDTVFVLTEGRWIANALDRLLGLKRRLRGQMFPIVLGFPFGVTPELVPAHLPLPAKIRNGVARAGRRDRRPRPRGRRPVRGADVPRGRAPDPTRSGPPRLAPKLPDPRLSPGAGSGVTPLVWAPVPGGSVGLP